MVKSENTAQYVEGRGLVQMFEVYCQVQGFRYTTKVIRGQGVSLTSTEIGIVPQGVQFRSSPSSFFFFTPVPVANYFARNRLETKKLPNRRRSLSLFRNVS